MNLRGFLTLLMLNVTREPAGIAPTGAWYQYMLDTFTYGPEMLHPDGTIQSPGIPIIGCDTLHSFPFITGIEKLPLNILPSVLVSTSDDCEKED